MLSFKLDNGDFRLKGDGQLERISGVELLKQKVRKALFTNKENILNSGAIPFRYNPNYGQNVNYIRQLLPIFTSEDARQAVQSEIRNALLEYAKIQNTAIGYGLTADETLVDANVLASIVIDNSAVKRVVIVYEAELITASGKTETFEGEISSPLGG